MRRALVRDDVVMNALLHVEQEVDIERLGPEVLDEAHRLQERRREGLARREARRPTKNGLRAE